MTQRNDARNKKEVGRTAMAHNCDACRGTIADADQLKWAKSLRPAITSLTVE